jgi:hypothetical protein
MILADRESGASRQIVVSLTESGAWHALQDAGIELHYLGLTKLTRVPGAFVRLIILMRRIRPDVVMTWLNPALATIAAVVSGVGAGRVVWNLSGLSPDTSGGTRGPRFKLRLLAGLSPLPWAIAVGSLSGRRAYEALGYRPRRWFRLSDVALEHAIDGSFDRRYGINTCRRISARKLRSREPLRHGESTGYAGTPARHFSRLIQALAVRTKEYHFVDVGSGKGRIVILAAMHDFRAVTGIELSPTIHDVALQNLAAIRNFGVMKCEPELLNMDALDYEFPPSPLLLYLYNPFRDRTMERFVDRIAETYHRSPRHILIAYYRPDRAHVFRKHSLFEEIKLGGSRLPRNIRLFEIPATPSPPG